MDRITQSSLNRFAHLFAAETLVSRPICRYPELFRDDSRNFPRIDVLPARQCRERFSGVKIVMLPVHDYGAFIHGIPHHADNVCSREWFPARLRTPSAARTAAIFRPPRPSAQSSYIRRFTAASSGMISIAPSAGNHNFLRSAPAFHYSAAVSGAPDSSSCSAPGCTPPPESP